MNARGGSALVGVSSGVAQGNYLGAGVSALGASHVNPATVEGLSVVSTVGVSVVSGAGSGIVGGVVGGVTAGAGIIASGIMSGAIEGIVEGVTLLQAYAAATQKINQAISNLQTQTDVDDQEFQNYLTQSYLNGSLIVVASTQNTFPPQILPAQGMSFILASTVAFIAAFLIE